MNQHAHRLKASDGLLTSAYDCAMLDLDGVVYVGADAVEGVPERLAEARRRGMTLAFVTNNAARTPSEVARQLRALGVEAADSDVVTSAQAAAAVVARRFPAGARVLVVGGDGLVAALEERGLSPVSSADDDPAAVVQGFHPTVSWPMLAEASYAIARGIPWIASNLDPTVPTPRGLAPGNGSLVEAVGHAVGRGPDEVAGKPYRPLFDETVERTGAQRPLVIGDRLDTDIEGAVNCGADSLLVTTGVTSIADVCRARDGQRPDYVATTMAGLLAEHAAPQRDGEARWSLGGWRVAVDDVGAVQVEADGSHGDDGLRAGVAACWEWLEGSGDEGDNAIDTRRLEAAMADRR
ncbi:MAG TPA: HAD-IIA family hydrolase [Nocardioidaceae bacterium]|nr:HAD-IIA family hydrolase [Nocardioidaceae bacterium]